MPDSLMPDSAPAFRNRSADTAKLAAALAAAQKAFAPIPKDREVTVRTKTGGSYKFKYATLDAIRAATMPALAEQGLAITQGLRERGTNLYSMETTLFHSSGEWISNSTPMIIQGREGSPPGNQELGSAQSYARRYGWSALLCITADEDDDGNTADGNHIERSSELQRPANNAPHKPAVDSPSDWVDDAVKDGLMQGDDRRSTFKRTYVPVAERPTNPEWLEKTKKKVDAAIGTLRLSGQSVETVDAFWQGNAKEFDWIKTHMPDEFARLEKSYMDARDAVEARMPVRNTLMAG